MLGEGGGLPHMGRQGKSEGNNGKSHEADHLGRAMHHQRGKVLQQERAQRVQERAKRTACWCRVAGGACWRMGHWSHVTRGLVSHGGDCSKVKKVEGQGKDLQSGSW